MGVAALLLELSRPHFGKVAYIELADVGESTLRK